MIVHCKRKLNEKAHFRTGHLLAILFLSVVMCSVPLSMVETADADLVIAACGDRICQPSENVTNCEVDCPSSFCGDGYCQAADLENGISCGSDCAATCGDRVCQANENVTNCEVDCPSSFCGDGYCQAADLENGISCGSDCAATCGDRVCQVDENVTNCEVDCPSSFCGNGFCEAIYGENSTTCNGDCPGDPASCGDAQCQSNETFQNCSVDCPSPDCGNGACEYWNGEDGQTCGSDCVLTCGDAQCQSDETFQNCSVDCPSPDCGNGACEYWNGEDGQTCGSDCVLTCGDAQCQSDETFQNCSVDCPSPDCGNGACEYWNGEDGQTCGSDCVLTCGDAQCQSDETFQNCSVDCPSPDCGNGACEYWNGEDGQTCGSDCVLTCGDAQCQFDETFQNCSVDCPSPDCGNGACEYWNGEDGQTCGSDCVLTCGDAQCQFDETFQNCSVDCPSPDCGNGACEYWNGEDGQTCGSDCVLTCGDAQCQFDETFQNCSVDCPSPDCGNGVCETFNGEDSITCAIDCGSGPSCGDGVCQETESVTTCEVDCPSSFCGDGYCQAADLENGISCGPDCAATCGDRVCQANENVTNCEVDCPSSFCGDGYCQAADLENGISCGSDCAPTCGDRVCQANENVTNCEVDCPSSFCGDGYCQAADLENGISCGSDCAPTCGDRICQADENVTNCEVDCPSSFCGDGYCQAADLENGISCGSDCAYIIAQTPWIDNQNGNQAKNVGLFWAMGYHFTPEKDGAIYDFGGFYDGVSAVKLSKDGVILAEADVKASTQADIYGHAKIPPVEVKAGETYTVSVHHKTAKSSYSYGLTNLFPQTYGDITITGSGYATNNDAIPTNSYNNYLFGQVDIGFVPADPQTPWKSNPDGIQIENLVWNYTMGYHFTPNRDGDIVGLGALFDGSAPVRVWDKDTGELLVETTVASSNNWRFSAIEPLSVQAGKTYTVAVYLGGQAGTYKYSFGTLPKVYGDVTIEASTYQFGDLRPTNNMTTLMFGQVDIQFVSTGATQAEGSIQLEAGRTANVVVQDWYSVNFQNSFTGVPVVVAAMETTDGGDSAGVRMNSVTATGMSVKIEEEQSANDEIAHTTEVVGYLASAEGTIKDASGAVIGEVGKLTTAHNWTIVNLANSYTNPVVVAQGMTFNGGQAAHARIQNVGSGSFEVKIEEWEYLDGGHAVETVGYVVLEKGAHALADGTKLDAGTVSVGKSFSTVNFAQSFATSPVVVSRTQTVNEAEAVVTRQRSGTATSFQVSLEEEEALGAHVNETVGYIAIGN